MSSKSTTSRMVRRTKSGANIEEFSSYEETTTKRSTRHSGREEIEESSNISEKKSKIASFLNI